MPMYVCFMACQWWRQKINMVSKVSGLKEYLHLEGNQYSNLIAMFTAG
jgi:hypothetical protein